MEPIGIGDPERDLLNDFRTIYSSVSYDTFGPLIIRLVFKVYTRAIALSFKDQQ